LLLLLQLQVAERTDCAELQRKAAKDLG